MSEDFVYIKYTKGQRFNIHLVMHHPWEFTPYLKLPRQEFFTYGIAYFRRFKEEFELVTREEYEAWEAAEAAKAAEVHYCGDFGGRSKGDKFCGKRVFAAGDRCEHHGGPTGEFECTLEEMPRPEKGLAP